MTQRYFFLRRKSITLASCRKNNHYISRLLTISKITRWWLGYTSHWFWTYFSWEKMHGCFGIVTLWTVFGMLPCGSTYKTSAVADVSPITTAPIAARGSIVRFVIRSWVTRHIVVVVILLPAPDEVAAPTTPCPMWICWRTKKLKLNEICYNTRFKAHNAKHGLEVVLTAWLYWGTMSPSPL